MTPAVARARIEGLAERIATAFRPERIVLFGSFAYGSPTPDSDVDLLVVMPCVGKPWRKAVEIRNLVRPEFPVDLLVRTPEQIAERVALGDGFVREILDRGTVLYEAPRG
jgi:predicted nucleotidyltransferase